MYLNELEVTLKKIQGKWKAALLYALHHNGAVRFNELQRQLDGVSHKTLNETLNQLCDNGLVVRKDLSTHLLHVEYSLSEKGESVIPVLDAICLWGETYAEEEFQKPLCTKK